MLRASDLRLSVLRIPDRNILGAMASSAALPIGVDQAVALVAAAAPAPPDGAPEAAVRQSVLQSCTVLGQVVTRKKVSKRMMFLNLRPSVNGAVRGGAGETGSGSFLAVIVKEHEVGAATMDWVRQGASQLRLGDYLRVSGALERDPAVGSGGAVLVVGGGERCLQVLERFEERNPGCHWEGHLFDAPSGRQRPRARPAAAASGGGAEAAAAADADGDGLFDAGAIAVSQPGAAAATAAAVPAAGTAGTAGGGVELFCKFWISTSRCNRRGCRFIHHSPADLPAARKAFHAARKRKGLRQVLEGDTIAPQDKRSKKDRAAVFVEWLVQTYGEEYLKSGSGVVDVAGGRGEVSFELCQRRGIPCSVIDPRLPGCGRLNNSQRRFVAAAEKEGRELMEPAQFAALLTPEVWAPVGASGETGRPQQLHEGQLQHGTARAAGGVDASVQEQRPEGVNEVKEEAKEGEGNLEKTDGKAVVDASAAAGVSAAPALASRAAEERHGNYHGDIAPLSRRDEERLQDTLHRASVLVGMHPDQATEFIVSCALALGKPWAVAPCCVFAREFPDRRLFDSVADQGRSSIKLSRGEGAIAAAGGGGATAGIAAVAGRPVVVFEDLVEYLRRKPVELGKQRAEQVYLPWQGKNCVVWST